MAGKALLISMVVAFVIAVQAFAKETIIEKGDGLELASDTIKYSMTEKEYDAGGSTATGGAKKVAATKAVTVGSMEPSSPVQLLNKSPMRLLSDYCAVGNGCANDADCLRGPPCVCSRPDSDTDDSDDSDDEGVPIPYGVCYDPSMYAPTS